MRYRQKLIITWCQVRALSTTQPSSETICELLWMWVDWFCPNGTQFLFYRPKLAASGRLLSSDDPIVDNTGPNWGFGRWKAAHGTWFPANLTKHIEKSFLTVKLGLAIVCVELLEELHVGLTYCNQINKNFRKYIALKQTNKCMYLQCLLLIMPSFL